MKDHRKVTQRRQQQTTRLAYLLTMANTAPTYIARSTYGRMAADAICRLAVSEDAHIARHMSNAMAAVWFAVNSRE